MMMTTSCSCWGCCRCRCCCLRRRFHRLFSPLLCWAVRGRVPCLPCRGTGAVTVCSPPRSRRPFLAPRAGFACRGRDRGRGVVTPRLRVGLRARCPGWARPRFPPTGRGPYMTPLVSAAAGSPRRRVSGVHRYAAEAVPAGTASAAQQHRSPIVVLVPFSRFGPLRVPRPLVMLMRTPRVHWVRAPGVRLSVRARLCSGRLRHSLGLGRRRCLGLSQSSSRNRRLIQSPCRFRHPGQCRGRSRSQCRSQRRCPRLSRSRPRRLPPRLLRPFLRPFRTPCQTRCRQSSSHSADDHSRAPHAIISTKCPDTAHIASRRASA